jgi:hypothetical protein
MAPTAGWPWAAASRPRPRTRSSSPPATAAAGPRLTVRPPSARPAWSPSRPPQTPGTAAGPGTATSYVIVGYQVIAGRTIAAAWWSAGLAGWNRAVIPAPAPQESGPLASGLQQASPQVPGTQLRAVTAGPGGFVAAGSDGNVPAAWTSADGGHTWTQHRVPLPAGTVRAVLTAVASNGRTVVATGTATASGTAPVPFAALSADGGRTWAAAALPVPAAPAGAQDAGTGAGASAGAEVSALTAAGAGFFATGTFAAAPGRRDVVVWTSPGGPAWTAATPAGPGLAGPGQQAITGLTASGGTLTGVGFSGTRPVFWQLPVR